MKGNIRERYEKNAAEREYLDYYKAQVALKMKNLAPNQRGSINALKHMMRKSEAVKLINLMTSDGISPSKELCSELNRLMKEG